MTSHAGDVEPVPRSLKLFVWFVILPIWLLGAWDALWLLGHLLVWVAGL